MRTCNLTYRFRKFKKTFLSFLFTFLFLSIGLSQTVPYTFYNNSGYADNALYVGMVGIVNGSHVWLDCKTSTIKPMSVSDNTVTGPIYGGNMGPGGNAKYANCFTKLSDIPNKTINIPKIAGCRIFISFNSQLYLYFFGSSGGYAAPNLANTTDPNQDVRFEIIELTYADNGMWANTTRVDNYQFPMGLEVWGNSSFYKKVGELKSHSQIISQWQSTAPSQFQVCLNTSKGIIHFPSKVSSFPTNYFQSYIDAIWSKYTGTDLIFNSGDAGVWKGRVSGSAFVFTRTSDGQVATITNKPSTLEAMEGSGVLASGGQWDKVVQAQVCAAINRHAIDLNAAAGTTQNWGDDTKYYITSPYNWYCMFWHQADISYNKLTYAFCYDDVFDKSSTINCPSPTKATVTIGGFYGISGNIPVTGVTVSPTSASIAVGATQQLTATVAPSNATNKAVSWTSSNTSVATVSSSGLVTGVAAGTATITVTTQDGNKTATASITVTSGGTGTNLALNKPTTVSSTESASYPGSYAVDGNASTRWASAFSDPQWIYVDLGASYNVNRVKIVWEAAYGKDFQIQVSANASTWTTIKTVTGNTVLTTDYTGLSGTGRYVRIYGTARGTVYGYSIFSLEVYGTTGTSFSTTIQAESFTSMSGVQTETTTDAGGGSNVGWIEANDWMAYPAVNIPAAGTYTIEYRVASLSGGGTIQFELAGGSPVYGTIAVPSTGGWQNWTTIKHTVTLPAGSLSFGIKALAGGWNINWFAITQGVKSGRIDDAEIDNSISFEAYPVPLTDRLTLKYASNVYQKVTITDITGKVILVKAIEPYSSMMEINVSNLKKGAYYLNLFGNGSKTGKMIVK